MYVGTHYNGYLNSRLSGQSGPAYGRTTGVAGMGGAALQQLSQQLGQNSASVYNQSAFGSDALQYVRTLKTAGAGLSSALKGLSSGAAFRQAGPVSSDKSVMTVKDGGTPGGKTARSVEVQQIAAAQVNRGEALKSSAASGVSGSQQLAIETGGKVSTINFSAKAGESNLELQQRMADAINAKGLGIKATVEQDAKAGTSALVLTGEKTGADQAFEVAGRAGEAFGRMGIAEADTEARDARFKLDGGETQTSRTNTINLGGGVTGTLNKASDEAVTVGRGVDADLAVSRVENLVEQYNSLYGAALGNESDKRANRLFSDLVSNSRTYSGQLSKAGIGFDENGYMTLDKEKASSAARDGSLEKLFTENAGRSYGFQNNLSRIAARAERNTNQYASPSSFMANTGSLGSPQADSIASLMNSTFGGTSNTSGWLFDFKL